MTGLRVGVVGMGIGQLHLLSWTEVHGATAVVLAEPDEARRTQAGRDWGLDAVGTLAEVLDARVDVVDLCTPPAVHEAQIVQCLEAGVHVICEKPLVDSLAACDRLASAAERAAAASGARLMPVLQYRFGPGAARAKALVDAGLTGRLFTASASTWWRRDRSYYDEAAWRSTWHGALGGTVVNHAVHIHDLLTWIGGPLADVHARVATRVNDVETEDCAVAVGRTDDGALVSMNVTTGAATESSRLTWCFEHVTIESSTEPYHPARGPWRFDFRDPRSAEAAENCWAQLSDGPQQYAGQFQAFVDRVDGGDLPVDLVDARAALELVTAWYHSARTGSTETLPIGPDHPCYESWLPRG
jgi:predicted dehydrogenase